MKKSRTLYCYVDNIETICDWSIGGCGEPEAAKIRLTAIDSYDTIQIVTKDLEFAKSLERGDRFEVALKYKPRKSGVTHVEG